MRNEIHDIQTRDALLLKVIDRVRILFAKNGDGNVCTRHRLLTRATGRNMHDRALNHALEAQRRLGIDFGAAWDDRRVLSHELTQITPQLFDIDNARAQHFVGSCIVPAMIELPSLSGDGPNGSAPMT